MLLTVLLVGINVLLLLPLRADSKAASGSTPQSLRVGLVFDVGGRGDKSFNDAAFRGVDQAVRELGILAEFIEPGDGADRESGLRLLAARGFDLILGVGFVFSDDMLQIAHDYPDRHFACVDYVKFDERGFVVPPRNMVALKFHEEEGSFLVGAIAALTSQRPLIGFVGGMDIPLIHKFEAAGREIQVVISRVDEVNFEWRIESRAKNAEVVFHAAGSTGLGVFEAARENHRRAIGVDSDQWDEAPGYILTSMVKRVEVSVFDIIAALAHGRFESPPTKAAWERRHVQGAPGRGGRPGL